MECEYALRTVLRTGLAISEMRVTISPSREPLNPFFTRRTYPELPILPKFFEEASLNLAIAAQMTLLLRWFMPIK